MTRGEGRGQINTAQTAFRFKSGTLSETHFTEKEK